MRLREVTARTQQDDTTLGRRPHPHEADKFQSCSVRKALWDFLPLPCLLLFLRFWFYFGGVEVSARDWTKSFLYVTQAHYHWVSTSPGSEAWITVLLTMIQKMLLHISLPKCEYKRVEQCFNVWLLFCQTEVSLRGGAYRYPSQPQLAHHHSKKQHLLYLHSVESERLRFGGWLVMSQSAGGRVSGIGPLGHPVVGQPASPARVVPFKDLAVVIAFFSLWSIKGKCLGRGCHHCIINL